MSPSIVSAFCIAQNDMPLRGVARTQEGLLEIEAQAAENLKPQHASKCPETVLSSPLRSAGASASGCL